MIICHWQKNFKLNLKWTNTSQLCITQTLKCERRHGPRYTTWTQMVMLAYQTGCTQNGQVRSPQSRSIHASECKWTQTNLRRLGACECEIYLYRHTHILKKTMTPRYDDWNIANTHHWTTFSECRQICYQPALWTALNDHDAQEASWNPRLIAEKDHTGSP